MKILPRTSLALLLAACQTTAPAEEPDAPPSAAVEGAAAAVGEAGPDAMMEAYAAAGMPGEHHAHLSAFVGTWSAGMKAWMPTGEVTEASGTMTNTLELDRRFLRQSFEGEMWGAPFEGRGFLGYDNVSGRYQAVWMDSTTTKLSHSAGSCSEDGRTFTFLSTETNPLTREVAELRDVIEILGPDRHTFARYYVVPGGEDVKSFEIVYQRKD